MDSPLRWERKSINFWNEEWRRQTLRYIYDHYTDIGGRTENEDSVRISKYGNNIVAVLADGLGGQGDGKAASQSVCESLILCGSDGKFPEKDFIEKAFVQANSDLIKKQRNTFHMKSTAVYLCVHGNHAIWAHIGDSRLYHLHQGKICDYTLDHSASQLSVFLGDIKREDIPNDPGRSRLVRAMGVADDTPDVHDSISLEKGLHGFLLCSDGLWEYLRDDEIEGVFARNGTASACLNGFRQIKAAKSPADCDNNSAIVVLLDI